MFTPPPDLPERRLARWQRFKVAKLFTWLTRALLCLAFLPSGYTKLVGAPFTALSTQTDIGYFFDALNRADGFYRLIGAAQMLAGVLLMIPRTSALGALMYLPLSIGIFAVTVSLHFQGTPRITGLMLLANLYLLGWEYPRWRGVLASPRPALGR